MSLFVRLLFIVAFSAEDCITDAWTSSSSTAIDLAALTIRRGCRRCRSRFPSEFPPALAVRQRQNANYGSAKRNHASCSFLHAKSNDDDGTTPSYLEEEEFYKEYESMYSPSENSNDNNSNTEKLPYRQQQQQQRQQQQKDVVPLRSTTASNNRKVELTEAWDEALNQGNTGASDPTEGDSDSDSDGRPIISNLSDLQQKLQQIQKRNRAGPIGGYSSEKPSNDNDDDDDDTALPSEPENKTLNGRGQQREVAKSFESSDRYQDILQKAQERLSEMTGSNDDSDANTIKYNEYKKAKVANMSSLQERLNQIQRDASATSNSDTESSTSDAPESSEQPLSAKYLDDETLAEWEDLDNQLQEEAVVNASKKQGNPPLIMKEPNKEATLADETAILDALRSQAAFAAANDSNKNDMDVASDIDIDSRSSSDSTKNFDDRDDNISPNVIPSNGNKKGVLEYEFTDDGGVFLSPEAYQEACNNANPDGSLNFGRGEQEQPSSLESAFVDDKPPMAPYGGDAIKSMNDLAEEANRSLEFARNNPDAQEELHRRLMAEFEAEEPTNDEFETDALMDPEKVLAFWNQEYIENQKEEVNALEDLLDQKMRALKEEEEERKNENSSNINGNPNGNRGQTGRRLEAQKNLYNDDKNIFFASRKERIDSRRMIESNRKERAKNIAKFYKESEQNSSWDSTSESKKVQEISKRQEISASKQVEEISTRQEISQNEITDSRKDEKSKEKFSSTKIQENTQSSTPNYDDQKVLPDTNQQEKDKSEWVLVEDPESLEDAFYWNDATSEMRWDPPEEG